MLTSLRQRATDLTELMDGPGCTADEVRGALRFLRWINGVSLARWMLGREVRRAVSGTRARGRGRASPGGGTGEATAVGKDQEPARRIRVLDVATGGGDVPGYLLEKGVADVAVGIDTSRETLAVARKTSPGVLLVRCDAFRLPFADGTFDAATSYQFFHHLGEEDCVRLLVEMRRVARTVVVMDLARSVWLYWVVRLMTWFHGNRLTRVDGPVSVRRAYTMTEMARLAARAGGRGEIVGKPGWRWCLRVG